MVQTNQPALTGRNTHLLGEQNRIKGNLYPNQQSKTRLIQKIGKITLSTWLKNWMMNKLEMQFCSLTLRRQNQRCGWINAKTEIAMELLIKENKKKADLPVKNLILEDLHDFLDVFDNNKANWFPESNMWDHKINMKEGFEPKSFKNYNLTPEEQKELDKLLDENLEKGYIRLWGLYEPTVMFFGMCNSPTTFQAMMDKIFKKEIEENLTIVYMDDILAFSKTINGLKKIEWTILKKAWEYNLYSKAKKCKFRKPKIKYLGLVVEEGKLAMDPAKLKGILDWPAPKTVKEVQSFIGFGNFYHRFVKGFSHLAHFLYDLLKKDKKFVWSEECQESFDQLKKWFTEEPVLMMPDHSKPF
jgi:Reverse transcriptase (RNA-dependent DNA polymerase)